MIGLAAACAALAAVRLAFPIKAEAWFSVTHRDITGKALRLIETDGRRKAVQFFAPFHSELLEGCTEPDNSDDTDSGAGKHYYSCTDSKGRALKTAGGYYKNRLGRYAPSARTLLEENFTAALCLYKSGMIPEAMRYIGRAVHFVEDMSCTVHVTNSEYDDSETNLHHAYEKHINGSCSRVTAEHSDKRLERSYSGSSFERAVNKLISSAAVHLKSISTLDKSAFEAAADVTLRLAQQNAAALMMRFYNDCKSDGDNYIRSGDKLTLRNAATGLYLNTEGGRISAQAHEKKNALKLRAVITPKGTFSFVTDDGRYLGSDLSELVKQDADAKNIQFRLAAAGRGRFRIMAEDESGFTKALGVSNRGKLTREGFDPCKKEQVWILI